MFCSLSVMGIAWSVLYVFRVFCALSVMGVNGIIIIMGVFIGCL